MKTPQIFKPEDFDSHWTKANDKAQAIFEKWYLENVYVPHSKSEMKRVICQTQATKTMTTMEIEALQSKLDVAVKALEFCRVRSTELQKVCDKVKDIDPDWMEQVITAFEIQAREALAAIGKDEK